MAGHIVHSYDQQLQNLAQSIGEMGSLIRELLGLVEVSIKEPSQDKVDLARATDKKVNALDLQIENNATSLLALRQPMAVDLRMVIAALKITVMLERMGDLAKNCAKRAFRSEVRLQGDDMAKLSDLIHTVRVMLDDAMKALADQNIQQAAAIALKDEDVDAIYKELMDRLQKAMQANPIHVPSYMQLIFIIRNVERMGDYVVKIAKLGYYIVSGERAPKISKVEE